MRLSGPAFVAHIFKRCWPASVEVSRSFSPGVVEIAFAAPCVPVQEATNRYVVPAKFKNFPILAWGFTIGPTITKL